MHRDFRPFPDVRPHFAWKSDLLTDEDRGKRRGKGIDSLATTVRRNSIDEVGDHRSDSIVELLHRPRSELAGDKHPLLLMLGIVAINHRGVIALVSRRATSVFGGEHGSVLLDLDDVFIPGDPPQLVDRVPVNRVIVPKPSIGRPRIDVKLRIKQIQIRRLYCGHNPSNVLSNSPPESCSSPRSRKPVS